MTPCEYPGANHSDDRVTIFTGSENPRTLCGYHETWERED